jgi:hypothetical protein
MEVAVAEANIIINRYGWLARSACGQRDLYGG